MQRLKTSYVLSLLWLTNVNHTCHAATTQAALRKRGITYAADLRLASDEILDQVIEELVSMDMPPMPVAWAHLEEMVSEVQYYGTVCPSLRSCCARPQTPGAKDRMGRVHAAHRQLMQRAAQTKSA